MMSGINAKNNERRQSMKEQNSQRALDDLIELVSVKHYFPSNFQVELHILNVFFIPH